MLLRYRYPIYGCPTHATPLSLSYLWMSNSCYSAIAILSMDII